MACWVRCRRKCSGTFWIPGPGSLDFPGSEDLAQRFKTLVPPEALAASEQQDPKTQLVTLQNQVKQATEALQHDSAGVEQSKQTETVATQQVAMLEQPWPDAGANLDNSRESVEAMKIQKCRWSFRQ